MWKLLSTDLSTQISITTRYQELHDLIRPYVVGADGEIEGYTHLRSDAAFDAALDEMIQHAESRYQAATAYLKASGSPGLILSIMMEIGNMFQPIPAICRPKNGNQPDGQNDPRRRR